jgi:hypothetical protein
MPTYGELFLVPQLPCTEYFIMPGFPYYELFFLPCLPCSGLFIPPLFPSSELFLLPIFLKVSYSFCSSFSRWHVQSAQPFSQWSVILSNAAQHHCSVQSLLIGSLSFSSADHRDAGDGPRALHHEQVRRQRLPVPRGSPVGRQVGTVRRGQCHEI